MPTLIECDPAAPEQPASFSSTAKRGNSRERECEFVRLLKRGDEASCELLVRRYGGRMLAVAQRLLGNQDEVQDVIQEAFLGIFRNIHRFREESQLATWLHRITVNAALLHIRTEARRPTVPIEELLPTFDRAGWHASPIPMLSSDAEHNLMRKETRERVRHCIDRLPEPYRIVLLLRYIEELDTYEVSELLEMTPNAVRVRLHRSRQALASLLSNEFGGESTVNRLRG